MNSTIDRTQYRQFGRTGLQVSPLGFGGAPIGLLQAEQDETARVLNLLLDSGVNVIDTAAMYWGSEDMIGRAIGHRRDEFVLISKCGPEDDHLDAPAWSATLIEQSIDRSLKDLRTDCIDVMLLHSCDLDTLKKGEALATVIKAREAGKVRFVGYSGDNEAATHAVGLPDIAVLQTSISICDQVNIDVALPGAQANQVGVMVKRPIANAAWKPEAEQYERYRDYVRPYRQRFEAMGLTLADLGFEGNPAQLWPEVALRFTLAIPGVHTAIIGTTQSRHVEANLAAAAKGPLPEESVRRVRDAFTQADPDRQWRGET